MKAYNFRIYPTKAQGALLEKQMGSCAFVYNYMLNSVIDGYLQSQTPFRKFDLVNELPSLKERYSFLKNVHSQVLQNVPERINTAFKGFFRRAKLGGEDPGFPRFKSSRRYKSMTYPQYSNGCSLDGKLSLSKIGAIKVVGLRELQGKPKTITIKRTSTGKWFASISCETQDIPKKPLTDSSKAIGIDMGLESFLTDSNNVHIENPRFFRKEEKSLAKAQSKRDKTPKTTPLRKKRSKVVSRINERIANKRDNFCHQLSRKLVNENDLICMEKLEIQDMQKNKFLSKSIQDVAWNKFAQNCIYKAEEAGKYTVQVNPAYTSQMCSNCGEIKKKSLSQRQHKCSCGLSLHRDHNAAINILALGLQCMGVKSLEAHLL